MSNLQDVADGLQTAFNTLAMVAKQKKATVSSVTINLEKTNLSSGVVVGTALVKAKSAKNPHAGRRGFSIKPVGSSVQLSFLGGSWGLLA